MGKARRPDGDRGGAGEWRDLGGQTQAERLLEWSLARTPAERLAWLQDAYDALIRPLSAAQRRRMDRLRGERRL